MNDEAREILVAAALRGHRQVRGTLHDSAAAEGECALGVLHLAAHQGERNHALTCTGNEVLAKYDISHDEMSQILKMNDHDGADFLTIAREAGRTGREQGERGLRDE